MSVNIEDILLLKSQQEAANQNLIGNVGGSLTGAALGAFLGTPRHAQGQRLLQSKLKDRLPLSVRPGARMAGGLVGMGIGGALGPEVAREMQLSNNGAGALLAKIQLGAELNPGEEEKLIQLLGQAYGEVTGA